MLVFCLVTLSSGCLFAHLYHKYLGFKGVFYLIFSILFINALILSYSIYSLWLFNENYLISLFEWINLGNNLLVYFTLRVDSLNLSLVFVMSSGGLFVFWFVFIDMWDDKENFSFFINLGYFLMFMMLTVSGGNLFTFYLGWEGIGIMSLVLVSFWSERVRSLKATYKIFLITKIGDFFVLILLCWLLLITNECDFYNLNLFSAFFIYLPLYTQLSLGFLLLLAGSVKSAQLGFHIWLLEAMEAPLGASALMHSSTLVIAGIVLIAKLNYLITINIITLSSAYLLGLVTACAGALIACFQYELKVIMAYSTISNMGYLLLLLVTASYNEFFFLLVIHAYIKIFLFLIVGAIILHANGCQDIRWINQLSIYNPTLFGCLFLGLVNLSGLPYSSGYFCKQGILLSSGWTVFSLPSFDIILCASYLFTFVYNFRLFFLLTFNPKLGHTSLFKKKNFFLSILINFLSLLVPLIFFKLFINIFNDFAYEYYSINFYIFFIQQNFYNHSPILLHYFLWIFVYFIFFGLIYVLLTVNLSVNFFNKWYLLLLCFYLFFFYILVICL